MPDNPFEDREPTQFRPSPELASELQQLRQSLSARATSFTSDTSTAGDNARMHVHVAVESTGDTELDAMQLCLAALDGLDNVTKVRVLNWLSDRSGGYRVAYPYSP